MTSCAVIFGFGSFFNGIEQFRDVDLLVVHENSSTLSCTLASRCKRRLLEEVKGAHVTMLSVDEEQQLDFVRRAKAIEIGIVSSHTIDSDINYIASCLRKKAFLPKF